MEFEEATMDDRTRHLVPTTVLLLLASSAHAQLRGLRDGATAYIRVPEGTKATLAISYEPVWAWKYCLEHFYGQAPDGTLRARKELPAGTGEGA